MGEKFYIRHIWKITVITQMKTILKTITLNITVDPLPWLEEGCELFWVPAMRSLKKAAALASDLQRPTSTDLEITHSCDSRQDSPPPNKSPLVHTFLLLGGKSTLAHSHFLPFLLALWRWWGLSTPVSTRWSRQRGPPIQPSTPATRLGRFSITAMTS